MQRPFKNGVTETENYFISMTDMMVGILFVFIIMLMAFALNLKETEDTAEKTIDELTGNYETRKEILENIQEAMLREGIKVAIDVENGILRLPEEILFNSGRADLNQEGLQALEKLHKAFVTILPCYTLYHDIEANTCDNKRDNFIDTIFIEGHTDDVPINTYKFKSNWELSVARSIETFKIISEFSPHIDTMKNGNEKPILGVSGYSDTRNIAQNTDKDLRRTNRRIDLRILMSTPTEKKILEIKNKMNSVY